MSRYAKASAFLLITALIFPELAKASIKINEVAWMGSVGNANAEWIELVNEGGTDVSLAGWTLTTDGTAPSITFARGMSIAAGGYFLLERSSDDSVPGIPADQTYTGALSNSGSTLFLKDASGAEVDRVIGGSNWSGIGGNNDSKKTPQRTGSGWVTATPTPKAQNATEGSTDTATTTAPTDTASSTPVVTIGGTTPTTQTPVKSPARELYIDAGNDRIVPLNVPTPYRAVVYSEGGNLRNQVKVTWNFGDGVREEGKEVEHTYRMPGEYVVTIRASDDVGSVVRTLRVVVEAYDIRVASVADGVSLSNTSNKLVDLSDWKIISGEGEFEIPKDTALQAGKTIVLIPEVTGLSTSTEVRLEYPNGKLVSSHIRTEEIPEQPVVQPLPVVTGIQRVQTVELPQSVTEPIDEPGILAPTAPQLMAAVGAAVPPVSLEKAPLRLLCLFGSMLACGAAFVVR